MRTARTRRAAIRNWTLRCTVVPLVPVIPFGRARRGPLGAPLDAFRRARGAFRRALDAGRRGGCGDGCRRGDGCGRDFNARPRLLGALGAFWLLLHAVSAISTLRGLRRGSYGRRAFGRLDRLAGDFDAFDGRRGRQGLGTGRRTGFHDRLDRTLCGALDGPIGQRFAGTRLDRGGRGDHRRWGRLDGGSDLRRRFGGALDDLGPRCGHRFGRARDGPRRRHRRWWNHGSFLRDAATDMLPIRMWQDLEGKLDVSIAAVSSLMVLGTLILMVVMERLTGISKRIR